MPMVGTALAALLKPQIITAVKANYSVPVDGEAELTKFAQAIADALGPTIVSYIQANATVVVTVASVTGVTTGPSISGPGTGTGVIS